MQDGLRNVHSSMIQRCENPKRQQYSRYGGRGIKVCEEWHNSVGNKGCIRAILRS